MPTTSQYVSRCFLVEKCQSVSGVYFYKVCNFNEWFWDEVDLYIEPLVSHTYKCLFAMQLTCVQNMLFATSWRIGWPLICCLTNTSYNSLSLYCLNGRFKFVHSNGTPFDLLWNKLFIYLVANWCNGDHSRVEAFENSLPCAVPMLFSFAQNLLTFFDNFHDNFIFFFFISSGPFNVLNWLQHLNSDFVAFHIDLCFMRSQYVVHPFINDGSQVPSDTSIAIQHELKQQIHNIAQIMQLI